MGDDKKEVEVMENATNITPEKNSEAGLTTESESRNEKASVNGNSCDQSKDDTETMKKKATQLLLLGKRNILIRDFQAAVAALAESCQIFTKIYDEQADEMGDPYYYYGKALFELARNESEVLGDQVQDEEDEDDEEEGEDAEGETKEEKDGDSKMDSEESDNKQVDAEMKDENSSQECAVDEKKSGEETDDVNDLQLSWEYLELAKLIYKRNASKCKDTTIKLSEVYLTLGENGLESENYRTAIDDMKQALTLQQTALPEEDRRIAETYYHLGVAHSLDRNFDEAVSCFKSAIGQLEKKIDSLKARKEAGDAKTEEEAKDAFYTMDGEIEDIQSIIKDIEEKITDMNDYKNQIKAELMKQVTPGRSEAGASSSSQTSSSEAGSSSSSSIPVTDINHLVRKKRKMENEEESGTKRAKQENGV